MKPDSRRMAVRVAVFVSLLGLALPAQAYLDPSTGSMILSAIVGLFATIGLALKTYWYKFKRLFSKRPDGSQARDGGAEHTHGANARQDRAP